MDENWWHDNANVILLIGWMADKNYDVKEVAHAVEKPWKYGEEFAEAKAELAEEES